MCQPYTPPRTSASRSDAGNDAGVFDLLLVRSHDDRALVLRVRAGLEATTLGSPVDMRHEGTGSHLKVNALRQFPSLTVQDGVPIVFGLTTCIRWEPEV
ncbi:MAG: hypothetical protein HOI21_00155 [Bacteroidetes Order II. Incertae sedis bacterium]|nr:hypothetical protein [Bacteroidetes Order II. bacterium]